MSHTPLRGLTIGSGHFAPIQLAGWQDVPQVQIAGLASHGTMPQVEALATKFGIPVYGNNVDDVLNRTEPDFIDIVTPPATHGRYIRRAVDLGIPALCQKPLAPTVAEAAELVDYAADRGVLLLVNDNWRWQPWYRKISSLLGAGAIGKPFHTTFKMRPGDGWGTAPYPDQPYFSTMTRFVLIETGVHYVDTIRYLLGEIDQVTCVTNQVNPAISGEDLVLATLHTVKNGYVVYDADRSAYADPVRSLTYGSMTVEGEDGNLLLSNDGILRLERRDGSHSTVTYDIPDGWMGGCAAAAQQHAADVLLGRTDAETSGADYLRTMEVVEACYTSAQEGRTLTLSASTSEDTPAQR